MIHFIHGIHTKDPYKNIGKLEPYFWAKGYNSTLVHNYGYVLAVGTRFNNPGRAKTIGNHILPHDIIVGHSNGCLIAWMISNEKPVEGLVLINPALDDDIKFSDRINWIHVYYNHTDGAVPWANIFRFNHPMGDMGHDGYKGQDKRVLNIDCCNSHRDTLPCVDGHSAIFSGLNLVPWANQIVKNVEAYAYVDRSARTP